jgi:hypothetical protein
MKKQELISQFYQNHQELINYVSSLPAAAFTYSHNQKWSAGQQLKHVYLTLTPFPKALASKEHIAQNFGKADRPTWDYDTVLKNYHKTSLQAPERFHPEALVGIEAKSQIITEMEETLAAIQNLLTTYSEEELDSLLLPHPLLGKLTIREMFYLMTYHPINHLKQIEKMLESFREPIH